MIDALTVRALGSELQHKLVPGRVQNIFSITPASIGFEIYANHARHYLLASTEPQRARLLLVSEKLRSASTHSSPFLLLLKKYTDGALINRVTVVPRERILHIEFDHHAQGVSTLVVELIGNRSNLLLLDAGGIILDGLHRVPASVNRARTLEPHEPYLPPPSQTKADPLAVTVAELHSLLSRAQGETLAQRLVETIAGTSPLFARELAYRITGATDSPFNAAQLKNLHAELTRVWRSPAEPCLALQDDEPVEVAAFPLTHLTQFQIEPQSSMSVALEKFYGAEESYQAVKVPLRALLTSNLEKLERMRASLKRELVSADEIETLKLQGEMILGYQYSLQSGQTLLHAPVSDTLTLDIALDPQLTPLANANKYFDQYKRARDAQARVPARLNAVENEIVFVEQIINDLELAESRAEIDQVVDEARAAGLLPKGEKQKTGAIPRSGPREFTSPDGFQILVGKNARQNDAVTFDRAKPDDIWLHVRGHAGSHAIILANGADVPATTLEFAASLAAYYSQARTEGTADVLYAPRRYVRRVPGSTAHPGLVTVRDEKVIRVRPDKGEIRD